ncbi:hypothetical protein M5K25_015289 [Dendrobium thyrsiflorum]|uniref:Uncharacterized protein n=1 Tax=Dendrobium thyrsiflorum TaxID=117978 RepID=A0ABD0UQS9_DENTH
MLNPPSACVPIAVAGTITTPPRTIRPNPPPPMMMKKGFHARKAVGVGYSWSFDGVGVDVASGDGVPSGLPGLPIHALVVRDVSSPLGSVVRDVASSPIHLASDSPNLSPIANVLEGKTEIVDIPISIMFNVDLKAHVARSLNNSVLAQSDCLNMDESLSTPSVEEGDGFGAHVNDDMHSFMVECVVDQAVLNRDGKRLKRHSRGDCRSLSSSAPVIASDNHINIDGVDNAVVETVAVVGIVDTTTPTIILINPISELVGYGENGVEAALDNNIGNSMVGDLVVEAALLLPITLTMGPSCETREGIVEGLIPCMSNMVVSPFFTLNSNVGASNDEVAIIDDFVPLEPRVCEVVSPMDRLVPVESGDMDIALDAPPHLSVFPDGVDPVA